MTDLLELMIRAGRAVELARVSDEYQQHADQASGTPESAASAHRDAERACAELAKGFEVLAEGHRFMARRMEAEQARERRTGREYRAGGDAA